jgi:glycosyltransferase involved in cell wall biosynthesis
MKRVLIVSATAKRGGAERALATLVRRLPETGWQPRIALLERGALEEWLEGDVICHVQPGDGAVGAIAALAREADVVLANKWRGQLLAAPAAGAAARPCVWWQHDFPDMSPAQLLDGSTPAAAVVCGSDAVLAAQRAAAPALRAVKIGYGIPVADVVVHRGAGARVRAQLGAATAPLIGMAGRLAPAKRQDLFLRAAAIVAPARPDARFVIIGGQILESEAEYAARLPALAAALGIDDRVAFAGHRADAYAWIDALDVLVHPADREPFGLVIAEALALGKPVVAADAAGPAEILAGRGTLVAPGDPDALADGTLEALARPPGAVAPPRADDRMAEEFAQLLGEVAA